MNQVHRDQFGDAEPGGETVLQQAGHGRAFVLGSNAKRIASGGKGDTGVNWFATARQNGNSGKIRPGLGDTRPGAEMGKGLDDEDRGAAAGNLVRCPGELMDGGVRRRRRRDHIFQNHADCDDMARGDRDHLRPDTGFVDADRRRGVSIRHLLLDDVHDGPRCGDAQ